MRAGGEASGSWSCVGTEHGAPRARLWGKEGRGGKCYKIVFFTNSRPRGRGQVVVKQSGVFRESVR